jgi:hypothetical protein
MKSPSINRLLVAFLGCVAGGLLTADLIVHAGDRQSPLATTNSPELLNDFKKWTFDAQKEGEAPAGFSPVTVGQAGAGTWTLIQDQKAPSAPLVLQQGTPCPAPDCFHILLVEGVTYDYPEMAVQMRATSASPGTGGVVVGAKGGSNGYAVLVDLKANVLEFLVLKDGKATKLGEAAITPKKVDWHHLRVQRNTIISKEYFEVFFDGKLWLSVEDKQWGAGQVGLVTRGDGQMAFDSLAVSPLFSSRALSPPAAY